ncbi:MAG: hypothetical protein ACKO0U_04930 [Gammaproteobacteria bacterium]
MPLPITEANPLRLFVSHDWREDHDYHRVFEFLEARDHFHYRNCARPGEPRPVSAEGRREALRDQIAAAEVVVLLAAQYAGNAEQLVFMASFAKLARKPVIVLRYFGASTPVPTALSQGAAEILDWDGRALVDAFRRHARGEDTSGWEVVEFKLD